MSLSYADTISKLSTNENFAFTRWGDGEWKCMLKYPIGNQVHNCDRHKYFEDLGEELRNVLISKPDYYVGMQGLAQRQAGDDYINPWLKKNGIELDWGNADIFHHESGNNGLDSFFEALKGREVYCVGKKELSKLFDVIGIPRQNCWLISDQLIGKLIHFLGEKENCVILFCSSMAANVWIDMLWKMMGDRHTLIDCGSMFDPYIGETTRTYHKKVLERLNK